jgi:hypothetical protein
MMLWLAGQIDGFAKTASLVSYRNVHKTWVEPSDGHTSGMYILVGAEIDAGIREQDETKFGYVLLIQPHRHGSLSQPLSMPRIWIEFLIRSRSGTSKELGVESTNLEERAEIRVAGYYAFHCH